MRKFLVAAAVALVMVGSAAAAEVEAKMLNKGAEGAMIFEPSLVRVSPGDTVRFLATDKGYNAETIKGMLPDGAAPPAHPFLFARGPFARRGPNEQNMTCQFPV